MGKRLNKAFYVASFGIGEGLVIVFSALIGLAGLSHESTRALTWFALSFLPFVYVAVVLWVLVYKMWESIQDGYARTTPGKAVGYAFIPIFNLYWAFQVLWGFSKDYNHYLDRHSVRAARLPQGLFLAYTTLVLISNSLSVVLLEWSVAASVPSVASSTPAPSSLIPLWVSVLVALAATYALGLVMITKICDGVNALSFRSSTGIALYCSSGEFAGAQLSVPSEGLVIGRSAEQAHLILSSEGVSAAHARVWPDGSRPGVWIQDLHSTNGTYFFEPGTSGCRAEWVRLREPRLLVGHSHFRIGDGAAEFEVLG